MKSIVTISDLSKEHEKACREYFGSSVLGIYRVTPHGRPDFEGSAFLVRIDDRVFAVTAEHVLRERKNEELYLATTEKLILLSPPFHVARSLNNLSSVNDDVWDVVLIELSDKDIGACSGHKIFEQTELHTGNLTAAKHLFSINGCPASKNKMKHSNHRERVLSLTTWTFACSSTEFPESWMERGASAETHLCLKFDAKAFVDDEARKTSPPHLNGMSGGIVTCCPINVESMKNANWPSRSKVVAVFLEYKKQNQCMLAVKLGPLLKQFSPG